MKFVEFRTFTLINLKRCLMRIDAIMRRFFAAMYGLATACLIFFLVFVLVTVLGDAWVYRWQTGGAPGVYERSIERDDIVVKRFIADNNRKVWIKEKRCLDGVAFAKTEVYRVAPVQILSDIPCPPEIPGEKPKLKPWEWPLWQWQFMAVPKAEVSQGMYLQPIISKKGIV